MKKINFILFNVIFLFFFITGNHSFADVFSVTDLNTSDLNTIGAQGYNQDSTMYVIEESYGEKNLIPYPSHDGYAVINDEGEFFNKEISVSLDSETGFSTDTLLFSVTNDTTYTWSDYHFILQEGVTPEAWDNNVFGNYEWDEDNNELSFWVSDENADWVEPGETAEFALTLTANSETYRVDQIATTVPLPGAVWLLLSGIFGIVGLRRK